MNTSFKDRLAEALKIRGLRPIDIANKTGISKSRISQYLNGLYTAKQDAIYLLAKELNVSEAWLMGYDTSMERSNSTNKEFESNKSETLYTKQENEYIKKYRSLDAHGKKAIEAITDIELERETNNEETTNIKKVLQDDELKLITAFRQLTDEGKDKIMQCMIQTVTEIPYQRDEYKVEHVMNVPKDYDPETDEFTYIPVSAFGHGISFIKMSKIISEFNEIKHAALLEQEDDQPDF